MNFRIILVWAERRPEKVRSCVGRGCRVEPAFTVGCAADGEEDSLAGGLTFRYVLAEEVSGLVSNGERRLGIMPYPISGQFFKFVPLKVVHPSDDIEKSISGAPPGPLMVIRKARTMTSMLESAQ